MWSVAAEIDNREREIRTLENPYLVQGYVNYKAMPVPAQLRIVRLQGEIYALRNGSGVLIERGWLRLGANKFDGFSTEDMTAEIKRRERAEQIVRAWNLSTVTPIKKGLDPDFELVEPLLKWYESRQAAPIEITVQALSGSSWTYRRPE